MTFDSFWNEVVLFGGSVASGRLNDTWEYDVKPINTSMTFSPDAEWHNPHVDGHARLLLVCTDGYSSSLAAAALVELGYPRAGDVAGGFRAWRLAGLPVVAAPDREGGVLPGMHPPDPVS